MWSFISNLYANFLSPAFTSFLKVLTSDPAALFILIALLIILSIAKDKVKVKYLPQILSYLLPIIALMIAYILFVRFSPAITDFLKTDDVKTTPTDTTTPKTNTPTTTPTNNQTQKQLYYAVSCSTCWADGCVHNGYSYGGYDSYYYNYYRALCQSCRCNSYNAQSLWR